MSVNCKTDDGKKHRLAEPTHLFPRTANVVNLGLDSFSIVTSPKN